MKHDGNVFRVVFSPDSNCLLTASEDGTARVWNANNGERLSPPLDPDGWVKQAFAYPADPAVWKLEVEERSLEQLKSEAEWVSGHRIDRTRGGLFPLSREEMRALEERIQTHWPELLALSP
jgi:WD40 repeat protein